jgi:hypothetical protein
MKKVRNAFGVLTLAAGVALAQTQSPADRAASTPSKTKHKSQHQLELDLEQLSDKYDRLEKEMADMKADAQRDAERRDAQLQQAEKKAEDAQAALEQAVQEEKQRQESASAAIAQHSEAVGSLQSAVADLKTSSVSFADTIQSIQSDQKRLEAPNAIPFMGIGLKPGGFLAGETVNRQRGIGGDVNTQFSAIPFSGTTAGQLSEFNASGRQSRASLLAEGRLSSSILRGYYEGDFLSAGVTSNDNQSNSYTFRQRQAWGQAELKSNWIFTGGQMWSLATEYRSGLLNNREAIPQTIDAQYSVGFTWARQYGFRVVKKIGNTFWAGVSAEEAQTLNIGGHNLPDLVYQQAGNTAGLYNSTANYSFNFAPDLIAKIVYEPKIGHFEVFSIGRFFRARDFPNGLPLAETTSYQYDTTAPTTVGAFTTKTAGGGLGANARVSTFWNRLDIGLHGLAGNGLGRYSSATLPDLTAHPDGTLELLAGGSALGSLEWHAARRLDVYAYYGGEYVKRAFYPTSFVANQAPVQAGDPPQGQPIVGGYGAPTNIEWGCSIEVLPSSGVPGVPGATNGCVADNRNIQEVTGGYWFRFYKGPRGTLQQGLQFSYLIRHTWQGVGLAANPVTGTPALPGSPTANDNMVFTSFRYYLPQ